MKVISLSAYFDGQSIQLDEPYQLEPNTKLIVTVIPEQPSERETWLSWSSHQMNRAYNRPLAKFLKAPLKKGGWGVEIFILQEV